MRNKKRQLEKSSVWKSPIARNKFWLQCAEMFKKYKADSVISQFYQVINNKSIPRHVCIISTHPKTHLTGDYYMHKELDFQERLLLSLIVFTSILTIKI